MFKSKYIQRKLVLRKKYKIKTQDINASTLALPPPLFRMSSLNFLKYPLNFAKRTHTYVRL